MKFVIGLLLAGIGYTAFDPTARAVMLSQTTGLIIGEYICVHIVIAAFVMMEFYAGMTANIPKKDWDEWGPGAFFLGALWPVTLPCYYIGRYVLIPMTCGAEHSMTSWTAKRREAYNREKES